MAVERNVETIQGKGGLGSGYESQVERAARLHPHQELRGYPVGGPELMPTVNTEQAGQVVSGQGKFSPIDIA
ncbi:MAG TPA: hypothetical protein VJL83_03480 [Patescibacteria group bacterium]|nr:hypothetical protein [Patescibacteria group bacterium]